MRTIRMIAVLTLGLTILAGPARGTQSYWNREFRPGENLFGNPLLNTNDNLSTIIPSPPNGTKVSLWDSSVGAYTATSTFFAVFSTWIPDSPVPAGRGARLVTGTLFTNTFVGTVLNADGSEYTGTISPPPVFTGSNGVYLLSSKIPLALSGTDTNVDYPVFNYILGRGPQPGESFTRLNPTNQTYHTTIWSGSAWSGGAPTLGISEAGFFNIGPVWRFEITAIAREGNNIRITWMTPGGSTNIVQITNGGSGGNFTNNFSNVATNIITGVGFTTTNHLDIGGALFTNRYYRVRLVP